MTSLRIGYTCHDGFPSTDTNTQQIFWTLSEMARLGHSVELHVPALPGGSDPRLTIARHYGAPDDHVPERLRFVARGTTAPASASARGLFDLRAPRRFGPGTCDVLWTRDPLALVVALGRGVPTVFETFRPDFAAARRFQLWRRATLGRPTLAGVIAHSRLAGNAFVAAGVPVERTLVAHNGHAPNLMEPPLSRAEARRRAGLPDGAPLVVYTGHVGRHKGTDALVRLAAAVPHACFVIVGVDTQGEERRWMEQCAVREGARNLVLVPRVGLSDVATYLYAADCLIVPPTGAPLTQYGRTVLPMKLFAYMAAGRPIVAPALPDIEEVLTDGRTAVLVPPGDTAAAAKALSDLLGDGPRGGQLASAACEAARAFTWAARARTITAAFEDWL